MTDEKMTDKTLANALAQQEAEYFQRHVDLTSKQYNLLLKLFQGAADSCLAEGRKRCAEESKERERGMAENLEIEKAISASLHSKIAELRKEVNLYRSNLGFDLISDLDVAEALQQQREGREK